MKVKQLVLAISLGLALTGTVVAATTYVISEPEVRTIVVKEGYGDPVLVERDGDLWRVKSHDNDSDGEVTVFVNAEGQVLGAADVARTRIIKTTTTTTTTSAVPTTTIVSPARAPTPVTEGTVATVVMNAGFHNVHDIDYLDNKGVWKAEADDSRGEDYELHVDGISGLIVHVEDD
jgi:membrane protein implicated in regulation of membrane protease activity